MDQNLSREDSYTTFRVTFVFVHTIKAYGGVEL